MLREHVFRLQLCDLLLGRDSVQRQHELGMSEWQYLRYHDNLRVGYDRHASSGHLLLCGMGGLDDLPQ
ncbi:hypothetical protein PHISCL_08809 [Aspergillus sclerotialis]|uniref:Uncharacterized protein n=1 Tax=Aspergillus sclerotialis TaxID=2070753 RepID=A0A3A2Z9F3_9EURO|nr:hypothetical protein PHISCL_08809 [Aspergillus sclerotialis]